MHLRGILALANASRRVLFRTMSPRSRVLSFGGAALVVVAGGVLALVAGGTAAEAVSLSLLSLGMIAIVSLVFLEVGLSEDRERERERAAAREGRRAPFPRRRRPD
jgi:membrane protein implicated in regulation of membrane protease activity